MLICDRMRGLWSVPDTNPPTKLRHLPSCLFRCPFEPCAFIQLLYSCPARLGAALNNHPNLLLICPSKWAEVFPGCGFWVMFGFAKVKLLEIKTKNVGNNDCLVNKNLEKGLNWPKTFQNYLKLSNIEKKLPINDPK
jgi:hypothetical protein